MGFWPRTSWAHLRVRTTCLGKVNPGYPEGSWLGIGGGQAGYLPVKGSSGLRLERSVGNDGRGCTKREASSGRGSQPAPVSGRVGRETLCERIDWVPLSTRTRGQRD